MHYEKLQSDLKADEGVSAKIYTDTVGKITGGVGRNLTDRGFSPSEIALMLQNDIALAVSELDRVAPWWRKLDDVRQNVMVNMMFNLGAPRLLGFRKFLAAVQAADWPRAAAEMMDSTWSKQVKSRANRLANEMLTGGA